MFDVSDHEWNLLLYGHFTDIELSTFALMARRMVDHPTGVMG